MNNQPSKRAVVLLSGGLDSATCLAIARAAGYQCYALSVDYGQRHNAELAAAQALATSLGAYEYKRVRVDLAGIGGSALTDAALTVPERASEDIPITYVPARNTTFLSIALGWAEVLQASAIYIGVNAVDYSGYPDCRPDFIAQFQRLANLATRAGVEGAVAFTIHAPLQALSKAEIIKQGLSLGVDYAQTVTCYQADVHGAACGRCDACRLRSQGFADAGLTDPTRYQALAPGVSKKTMRPK